MVGFFLIISGINASNGLAALVLLLLYAILVYSLIAVCWFMRAFAEITESVKATNKALQLTFERNIADAEENHRKEAEERAAAAKAEEEKLEAEIAAAEAARKKRFDDYWESHQEEAKALIAKKEEATTALNSLSGLAAEERAKLQKIIDAIDEELTKDR